LPFRVGGVVRGAKLTERGVPFTVIVDKIDDVGGPVKFTKPILLSTEKLLILFSNMGLECPLVSPSGS
jgi:hypothetical protein